MVQRIGPANRCQCEVCHSNLGVRLTSDRASIYNYASKVWVDACNVCKNQIKLQNRTVSA